MNGDISFWVEKDEMRNRLQYLYSVAVLMGVIVTSYLTMSQDGSTRLQLSGQNGAYRVDAGLVDAPVNELMQLGKDLNPKQQSTPSLQNREMGSVSNSSTEKRKTFPSLR